MAGVDAWRRAAGALSSARVRADAHRPRLHAVVVFTLACLAGAVLWAAAIRGGDEVPVERAAATPFGEPRLEALTLAVGDSQIWTVGRDRRLRSFSITTLAPSAAAQRVGGARDFATHVAVGRGAVWVALRHAGGGAIVRVDPREGGRRVLSTGELVPNRIVVLPGRVVAVGDSRVGAVSTRRGRDWSKALPGGVDVAAGYGAIWVLSRLPGGRGLVTRRDPGSGGVTGRRTVSAAATGIAVGLGAVWVANGCPNGVLRAPVGPGPGSCIRVGKGPSDVTVGAGAAWVADAAGARVTELDAATGAIVRAWSVRGRPAAVAASPAVVVAATRSGGVVRLEGAGRAEAVPPAATEARPSSDPVAPGESTAAASAVG